MMAFDHVFMAIARQESRAVQTIDSAGNLASFLFREYYCNEPGCDCRRVMLVVHWAERKSAVATINYGFERSRRRDEPQIFLDPMGPQSELSERFLAVFTEIIGTDREYRERLKRHYAMWKAVVDDPGHPEHAKVRSEAHDDPAFRPAFPAGERAAKRRGPARGAPAGSQSLERVAAKSGGADSKLQRRFRRLLQQVDRMKQRVRAWRAARPDIDSEISRHVAVIEELRARGRDMVGVLDRAYADPGFTKAERKRLAALICELAGELIETGHADLKPLYNRYSRSDFDAEAAVAEADSAAALREMMEMFGMEFGDADVSSLDKLKAFTEEQMRADEQREQEEEAAAEARRARRKKSAKQVAAEAKREEATRSTSKVLQDVFRALAKALHPDREQDPVEQARKTELMREVNVAYEAKDLLRLLELQLELERVEPERAEAIAEDRLRHYNRILDEQAKQLELELEELELPFRLQLGVEPAETLTPADVIARIRSDTEDVKQDLAKLVRDLKAFAQTEGLKSWLQMQMRPSERRRSRRTAARS